MWLINTDIVLLRLHTIMRCKYAYFSTQITTNPTGTPSNILAILHSPVIRHFVQPPLLNISVTHINQILRNFRLSLPARNKQRRTSHLDPVHNLSSGSLRELLQPVPQRIRQSGSGRGVFTLLQQLMETIVFLTDRIYAVRFKHYDVFRSSSPSSLSPPCWHIKSALTFLTNNTIAANCKQARSEKCVAPLQADNLRKLRRRPPLGVASHEFYRCFSLACAMFWRLAGSLSCEWVVHELLESVMTHFCYFYSLFSGLR